MPTSHASQPLVEVARENLGASHRAEDSQDLNRDLNDELNAISAKAVSLSSDVAEPLADMDAGTGGIDLANNPLACWARALTAVDGMVADYASTVVKIECSAANAQANSPANSPQAGAKLIQWTALFPVGADLAMHHCNESIHRTAIEGALKSLLKQPIQLALKMSNLPPVITKSSPKPVAPVVNQPTLVRKYSEHPLVKSLLKTIDGDIVRVDVKG